MKSLLEFPDGYEFGQGRNTIQPTPCTVPSRDKPSPSRKVFFKMLLINKYLLSACWGARCCWLLSPRGGNVEKVRPALFLNELMSVLGPTQAGSSGEREPLGCRGEGSPGWLKCCALLHLNSTSQIIFLSWVMKSKMRRALGFAPEARESPDTQALLTCTDKEEESQEARSRRLENCWAHRGLCAGCWAFLELGQLVTLKNYYYFL